jgi:hypothetical protein
MSDLIKWLWGKPLKEDSFVKTGELSTNEFKLAGDHLSSICDGWKWSSSLNPKYSSPDLDKNKQFLFYEKAMCKRRISELK